MSTSIAYIPVHALDKDDIQSILSIALAPVDNIYMKRRFDHHHSRRTMLYYLLSIFQTPNNGELLKYIKEYNNTLDRESIQKLYQTLTQTPEPYKVEKGKTNLTDYWELAMTNLGRNPSKSLKHISKYRSQGFQPQELKLYWNYKEIRQLSQHDRYNPTTDGDTNSALSTCVVSGRDHGGKVKFVRSGIQDAIFQVPENKQVIVLDFADERMPGGYFLEGATTQEEVILYNSDGYRALLDLKYKVMDGGYMLPEYGVAYVKGVRFFHNNSSKERLADLIVAACYDVSGVGEGLYPPPAYDPDKLRESTRKKFQSIIASAVANSEQGGSNTYLLLGPIGTGAFANNVEMIAGLFSEILNGQLMDSTGPIRNAFEEIWFVSIDDLTAFSRKFEQYRSKADLR